MDGLRFMLGRRSLASLMLLLVLAGLFSTPPVGFMIPAIVRFQLHAGAGTLGALSACTSASAQCFGSIALLALSRRPNKGEPLLGGFFLTALAIAALGVSSSVPLSLALAVAGGFCGVLFIGQSTVVVQAAIPERCERGRWQSGQRPLSACSPSAVSSRQVLPPCWAGLGGDR